MNRYRIALCWAAAILGVAVATLFGAADETTMIALFATLPVAGWMAVGGLRCTLPRSV